MKVHKVILTLLTYCGRTNVQTAQCWVEVTCSRCLRNRPQKNS